MGAGANRPSHHTGGTSVYCTAQFVRILRNAAKDSFGKSRLKEMFMRINKADLLGFCSPAAIFQNNSRDCSYPRCPLYHNCVDLGRSETDFRCGYIEISTAPTMLATGKNNPNIYVCDIHFRKRHKIE